VTDTQTRQNWIQDPIPGLEVVDGSLALNEYEVGWAYNNQGYGTAQQETQALQKLIDAVGYAYEWTEGPEIRTQKVTAGTLGLFGERLDHPVVSGHGWAVYGKVRGIDTPPHHVPEGVRLPDHDITELEH
jgi:hypothetical protein